MKNAYISIKFEGFDPGSEPVLRVYEDGTAYLIIEALPPFSFKDSHEIFHGFSSFITQETGIPIRELDREEFEIVGFRPEMIEKLRMFFKNFKKRFRKLIKDESANPPFRVKKYLLPKVKAYMRSKGFTYKEEYYFIKEIPGLGAQKVYFEIKNDTHGRADIMMLYGIRIDLASEIVNRSDPNILELSPNDKSITFRMNRQYLKDPVMEEDDFTPKGKERCDVFFNKFKVFYKTKGAPWFNQFSQISNVRALLETFPVPEIRKPAPRLTGLSALFGGILSPESNTSKIDYPIFIHPMYPLVLLAISRSPSTKVWFRAMWQNHLNNPNKHLENVVQALIEKGYPDLRDML